MLILFYLFISEGGGWLGGISNIIIKVMLAYQPSKEGNEDDENDDISAHSILRRSLELLINFNFALQPTQQSEPAPLQTVQCAVSMT